jgi:hypothetical protein
LQKLEFVQKRKIIKDKPTMEYCELSFPDPNSIKEMQKKFDELSVIDGQERAGNTFSWSK